MKTRLLRGLNRPFAKYLPEQRLYLRSDNSTRFLRLTPFTQASLGFTVAVFFCWTVIVSGMFLVGSVGKSTESEQSDARQLNYEARLNALSDERDKRALEAQAAQERFYVALDQISAQQSALLESEDRRKELETGIEVIQRTLRDTMKERDQAEAQSDTLLAELQTVTGSLKTQSGSTRDIENTLDYLQTALAETVEERDAVSTVATTLAEEVDGLEFQAQLVEERNERIFTRLEEAVTVSMAPLHKMFENAGLSTDKLLDDVKEGYSGTGGPLTPLAISSKNAEEDPTSDRTNALLKELDRVNMMRIAAFRAPFANPVHSAYRFTSGYGFRRHPRNGTTRMHDGVDFAAAYGTPLYATADGVVSFAGWAGGYGRVIKIQHPMGFETRYAHLARFHVKVGQRVSRGDRIGDMGSSGRSTGPHIHYEVRIGGKSVNPMTYIKAARNVF